MKPTKKFFLGAGSTFAAAILIMSFTPKAAHAVVAALVQVANTRSTPVPTQDVDQPGRHPYSYACFSGVTQPGQVNCGPPVNVPANMELVVQTVSMNLHSAVAPQSGFVTTTVAGDGTNTYIPLVAQQAGSYVGLGSVTLYQDAPLGAGCAAVTSDPNATISCSFTGYLVALP